MSKNLSSDAAGVGYGRPPRHSRFRKGSSGNPAGRRPGKPAARLDKCITAELLRSIQVRQGGRTHALPLVAAVMRQIGVDALTGSSPAQRKLVDIAHGLVKKANGLAAATEQPVTLEMLVQASLNRSEKELNPGEEV